ncbi:hypothetical protein Tc00.1047053508869.10 [Trypanosoma cruzi]|uniref:Uncharacterized protein n=1 Tax=Trypanosoma cruzi (strain CL Brener) TaxID=353153 RepID=Q4DA99_TRYCC|nr:hypothetical protein Tc00.1047053508869.10 [Trypanosoma cruzi]EAN89448.1 hypothetical protein Tc00.1047053508869.10 [Trypanosoma cruzi]|eukprot:XP_811299.1 hypothetical protein [Trypanosoma cruzi strain CL Brener]
MTPRAGNVTHGGHRAAASPFQHGTQANVPPSPRAFMQSTVHTLVFCVLEKREKEGKHGEANQHSKKHSWMTAIHAVRPQIQQSRTVAAHTHPQKTKKKKQKTRRQGVAVCVALRVSARPGRKTKQEGRNVCSAPQALVARPHVTAPSARRSSRPLLMRAAGEAHRAVVMSVSVGVRVEQLGGKHTAPLTGRVQKKQLKREE